MIDDIAVTFGATTTTVTVRRQVDFGKPRS